jgi:putative hydrolase of the HAD superfamily
MNIKAVVFDYGHVITLPQDLKTRDRLAERAGVEKEKFWSLLWALRPEYDRGAVTAREYYKKVLSRFDVSMDDKGLDEMVEIDSESWKHINPDTVALMEDVKNAGYILGIFSNMPYEFFFFFWEALPVFSLPQIGLFSCEVNLVKPEEAIYRKLLSLANVEGGELVFFDDKLENIEGARVLGIEAFLWKDPGNARRELLSLGVVL